MVRNSGRLLISLGIASMFMMSGCSGPKTDPAFVSSPVNLSEYELYLDALNYDRRAWQGRLDPGGDTWTGYGCPLKHATWRPFEDPWPFTLRAFLDRDRTELFAEVTADVTCAEYSFWIHPDGYIVAEKGEPQIYHRGGGYELKPPPWDR